MKKFTVLLLAGTMLVSAIPANAESAKPAPAGVTESPKNVAEFGTSISVPGTVSLMTSQIAVKKATSPDVKDFARFEVSEQETISSILTDMGTPKPKLSAEEQAMIDDLKATKEGPEFDKKYLQAQVDGHTQLNTIVDNYLSDVKASTPEEKEGKHLAMLANSTIDSHLEMSKKMLAKMK